MTRKLISATLPLMAVMLQLGAAPLELVSKPDAPRPTTSGDSADLELSVDGKWAVYSSSGSGITTNATDPFTINVFLKNLETGETTLVSRSGETNAASGNGSSYGATLSADGRYVVFESDADNLIEDDWNESSDVLLYDRVSGSISLVSGSTNGVVEGESAAASISPNGRFVLFESDASDLSDVTDVEWADLYLLDRETGSIELVTVNATGSAAAGVATVVGTYEASMSGDGRWVAFVSSATNHVTGITTAVGSQVYLRDMLTGTNRWLSRATNGTAGQAVSRPTVSSNGAYVVFLSADLEGTPSNSGELLYIYETAGGTRRALRNQAGNAFFVSDFNLSGNSEYLAFSASNQVYLHHLSAGTTRLVSADSTGAPAGGVSTTPQLSSDGRYVIFSSSATNLAAGVQSEPFQLYRFDAQSGEVVLLSRAASGSGGANSDAHFPVLSGNGAVAGFMSYADNLVTNDNATFNDVFVVGTSGTNAVTLASTPHPAAISSTAAGSSSLDGPTLSADGRYVIFSSLAQDIVPGDANLMRDVFRRDLVSGTTELISLGTNGAPLASGGATVGMSSDGQVIAFTSISTLNGTNARAVFVHRTGEGTTIGNRLPTGEVSQAPVDAVLSANGRYLAFREIAWRDVYIRDLEEETTTAISLPVTPTQLLGLSPGGKYLVARTSPSSLSLVNWRSNAVVIPLPAMEYYTNAFSTDDAAFLVPLRGTGSPAAPYSLYLYRLSTGTNATLVVTNGGTGALSADGSTVAYIGGSNAPAGRGTLFTYDVATGVSTPMQVGGTNASLRVSGALTISADGRYVAFSTITSLGSSAAEGDFNDVFVYDRVLKTTTLISETVDGTEGEGGASGAVLSADGRVVAFDSGASGLVANDRNFNSDVFIQRLGVVDTDGDGLEDGWETVQFGGLSAIADADADNDGVSNRNEFRAGTNPNSATSLFEVATDVSTTNDALMLTSPAASGRVYQLQHRASLAAGDWQDVGSAEVAYSGEVTFEAPITQQGNGFFRIKAVE